MAELILAFTLGAVAATLISWAWRIDRKIGPEPTEHGRNPL